MEQAEALYRQSGGAVRVLHEFVSQSRQSWSRARRVAAPAEYLQKAENPRFVVTSLTAEQWAAPERYEKFYCARGDLGTRIQEHRLLFSDRTRTACLRSPQLRLYFSSVA